MTSTWLRVGDRSQDSGMSGLSLLREIEKFAVEVGHDSILFTFLGFVEKAAV